MKKAGLLSLCVFFLALSGPRAQSGLPFPMPIPPGSAQEAMDRALSRMGLALESLDEPTLQDSYFLGRAVAAHIISLYGLYEAEPDLILYLNKILQALDASSPRPAATFRGLFLAIIDSPDLGAYSTPGGHIFLTSGLVRAADSEDMLAAVIAHELAHVSLSHGLAMIDAMSFSESAAEIAALAAEFQGDERAARLMLDFRRSVSAVVDGLARSGYSQAQEFEADAQAASILAAAGYDPGALIEALEMLARSGGPGSGGFFATHPSPQTRMARVRDVVARLSRPEAAREPAARLEAARLEARRFRDARFRL
ncbi:MAG: M48 family metalloprotease [Treponema sp.]|nr:M48 family metalloprotease [Treponema sp.]